jgi:ABC-type multidrug transport system fused ATPase/permease subunit
MTAWCAQTCMQRRPSHSLPVHCSIMQLDKHAMQPGCKLAPASIWQQGIRLDDVSFTYPGRATGEQAALRGVSLTLAAGECTAIVGRSGAGKSSLAQLLARVLKPDSGRIRVGGKDVLELDRGWYTSHVATVPQVRSKPSSRKARAQGREVRGCAPRSRPLSAPRRHLQAR